jgi:hypothetical protein
MYDVCPEDFDDLSNPNIKSWDEVPDSETKRFMQRSQRRNRGPAIVIRDVGTNRYHKLNLAPRNISKMFEDVDLSIFKTILNETNMEVDPDKNKDGQTSTQEVLTYFQDKNKDGHPDGEHFSKLSNIVDNMFKVGEDENNEGSFLKTKRGRGLFAEMHARLLSLGHGLDQIHEIQDETERSSALSNFLSKHLSGSSKSPSEADTPQGIKKKILYQIYFYLIQQQKLLQVLK